MAKNPFPAYQGDEPYFFVSYAHEDADVIYGEMTWLRDAGFNLWYDDGIHVGTVWRRAIAESLASASGLIFFCTARSVASDNCLKEVGYADAEQRPVFVVQLDDTPLPPELKLSLGDRQALVRSKFDERDYRERLTSALRLLPEGVGVPANEATLGHRPEPIRSRARSMRLWSRERRLKILATALGIALVVTLAMVVLRAPPEPAMVTRFTLTLPVGLELAMGSNEMEEAIPFALSPNSRRVVYSARDTSGSVQLHLRSLDQFDSHAIPGTDGGVAPVFSPDGQSVAFMSDGALKKVRLPAGPVITIVDRVFGDRLGSASWGEDGMILFAPSSTSGLYRVWAAGGDPTVLTTPDAERGELSHREPALLPGAETALLTIRSGMMMDESRVDVLSLETGERYAVVEGAVMARYAAGYLVYSQFGSSSLWAIPFDSVHLEPTGEPRRVLESLRTDQGGRALFSLAKDGSLAYAPLVGPRASDRLLWVLPGGEEVLLPATMAALVFARLSPEGGRIAVTAIGTDRGAVQGSDIWIFDLSREVFSRLTTQGDNHLPVWTHDGRRVVFTSDRDGAANLYWMPVDGSGEAARLTRSDQHQDGASWSSDGRVFAFAEVHPDTDWDLRLLDLQAGTTRSFLTTTAREIQPMISPDDGWIAYASDESGRMEVYIQAFPDGGLKHIISNGGGEEPLWAHDGSRLYYRQGNQVLAVRIEAGPPVVVETADLVFEGRYRTRSGNGAPNYDVTPDGKRFLVTSAPAESVASTEINVVLNWVEELKASETRN